MSFVIPRTRGKLLNTAIPLVVLVYIAFVFSKGGINQTRLILMALFAVYFLVILYFNFTRPLAKIEDNQLILYSTLIFPPKKFNVNDIEFIGPIKRMRAFGVEMDTKEKKNVVVFIQQASEQDINELVNKVKELRNLK
ncbi:MAG: hypothetical protein Kow00108_00150 [Calditrichia bacterium]